MLTYPWLLYYRRRMLAAALMSLLLTCLAHLWVSGNGFGDLGIFWHSFCGCPVDPNDAYFLLNVPPLITLTVGLIFGFLTPAAITASGASSLPGSLLNSVTWFFLTRPISRRNTFFFPAVIATTAIVVLPAAAFLLLVEWLHVVGAPSLHHLMATVRIIPTVSKLGQHPTLVQVLIAVSAGRRYLAAVSVGSCAYAILSAQRWLFLSSDKKLNALGFAPLFVIFAPVWLLVGHPMADMIFLAPSRGAHLTYPSAAIAYMPSVLGIVLHFAVAAAILHSCWRILRNAEP